MFSVRGTYYELTTLHGEVLCMKYSRKKGKSHGLKEVVVVFDEGSKGNFSEYIFQALSSQ